MKFATLIRDCFRFAFTSKEPCHICESVVAKRDAFAVLDTGGLICSELCYEEHITREAEKRKEELTNER